MTWIKDHYARLYQLCQAFDMSRNRRLTSAVGLLSNAVCISCTIESSWAMHESSGRKPDCEELKSLLLWKWLNWEL